MSELLHNPFVHALLAIILGLSIALIWSWRECRAVWGLLDEAVILLRKYQDNWERLAEHLAKVSKGADDEKAD